MMDFAFGKSGVVPKNLKKLFVVEKELPNGGYEHKLVYHEELLEIIKQKDPSVRNAYIYGFYSADTFDLDSEIFSVKRLERSFDVSSGLCMSFNHSSKVTHQNAINRLKPMTKTA